MSFYLVKFMSASRIIDQINRAETELGLLHESSFTVLVVGEKCAVSANNAFGDLLFHHVLEAEKLPYRKAEDVTLENLESVWQKHWDTLNRYDDED